jgi:serine/threonine protein phosphatase PrpC
MDSPSPSNPSSLEASTLLWSGWTDRGKVRKNNEDSFLGLRFNAQEVQHLGKHGEASLGTMDFAFAVSDGMGGALAGEFASKIAVEKITRLLPLSFKQQAAGLNAGYTDILTELYAQIHRALVYVGNSYEECRGMEATLSLCWFTPGWMYFGHIGDSRIFYLSQRDATFKQLSHDDTYVGWLFRNGQINEREARTHPRRNVLQKALGGTNQFVDPQVGAVAYEPGDLFLLCTDGLTEGLYNHQLTDHLRPPPTAPGARTPFEPSLLSRQLVESAVHADGRDNTTALVIAVGGA